MKCSNLSYICTYNRELKKIEGREVSCYSISAKENMNLEAVFKWLIARYYLTPDDMLRKKV